MRTGNKQPELSVVIPFFDEQDNVAPLLAEVDAALAEVFDYELVAVDDGSSDATPQALEHAKRSFAALRVARLASHCGQSSALTAGVALARAPLIATLDGDGQNPPAEIPRLVQAYRDALEGAPLLVVGWRKQRRDRALRRVSAWVANGLRRSLLRDDCPDTGCGLKVFARDAFLGLPSFDHMHRFLPALYRRMGGRAINVAVAHRPRRSGRSKYGVHNRLWVGIVDVLGVYWLIRRPCRASVESGKCLTS